MREPALAVLLVGLVVLSGCTGPAGPPVDPRTVPASAPSEAGDGDYNLTLQVRETQNGPPIEDAAVIVYWGTTDEEASGGLQLSGEARGGDDGGTVRGVVRVSDPSTPEPETTLTMRTDDKGRALAQAPTNRVVGIVAWAPGYTEEWIPSAVTGDDGAGGQVGFPLYRANLTDTINGTIGPAGASPGRVSGTNFDWYPEPVPWGDDDGARQAYIERLASKRLTLTWTNGPESGGGGDLSIGVGPTSSEPDYVYESDTPQTAPGDQTEEVALSTADIEGEGWPSRDELYVGPATSTAYAAPMGMDYELTVDAEFSPFATSVGDPRAENQAPAAGPGLAVLGLAGVALVLRRRA